MASILTLCRRHVPWPSSRQAWQEFTATLGLVAVAIALWWLGGRMLPVVQVLLWGVLVVVAAVLLRRGWLKLFGPVLFYDMVRSARRGRYALMRIVYAGLLFFQLVWIYNMMMWQPYRQQVLDPLEAARIAQTEFEVVMAVQLVAVLVLTPAYVAGSIADEKTRKTLEFILATDLRSREIVLSKLGSRLANLAVLILTGLPILSLLQFLGGVDPNLVLAGFAATGLTMLGLGGVSILTSTYCKRPRDAIAVAYMAILAYYAVSILTLMYQARLAMWMPAAGWESWLRDRAIDVIDAFNVGNLGVILSQVQAAGNVGQLADVIPGLLRKYALFQGVVAAVTVCWSVLRLRPVALRQMSSTKRRRRNIFGFRRRRPPVGDLPMVWKEVAVEGGLRLHWVAWLIMLVVAAATFVPAITILYNYFTGQYFSNAGWWGSRIEVFRREMNIWARVMTALVGVATLLAVAVRAATCVSSERDRQTLDSLLTTPLTAGQMLGAKALGNVTSVRLAWVWLGSIWLLALLSGGLHPFALPFLMGAWLIYAFFLSMLGAWFSVVSRSSQRAIVYTLLATVGLSFGHWLPWMCCIPMAMFRGGPGTGVEYLAKFQVGITPPFALGFLTFHEYDFGYNGPDQMQFIGFSVCGLFLWTCGTLFLWSVTLQRFRSLTLRRTEDLLVRHDQPYHRYPRAPRPRPLTDEELSARLVLLDERGRPLPRGARLLDERHDPPRPRGAVLIEEIRDVPRPRPRPPAAQDDE